MSVQKYYPPVSFYFRVEFQGLPGAGVQEGRFQEVSGLSVDVEAESLKAGGENRFTYKLPTKASYPNLLLKRGFLTDSVVIDWMETVVHTMEITPISILVILLNEKQEPLQSFQCVNAWPVKWSVDSFNSQESKVVIETMEWYYQYFKIL